MFIYQFLVSVVLTLVFVMTKNLGSKFNYIFSTLLSLTFSATCWVIVEIIDDKQILLKLVVIKKVHHCFHRVELVKFNTPSL